MPIELDEAKKLMEQHMLRHPQDLVQCVAALNFYLAAGKQLAPMDELFKPMLTEMVSSWCKERGYPASQVTAVIEDAEKFRVSVEMLMRI